MKHTMLDSTMLTSYGYDDAQQTLELTFKSGVTYRYPAVPADVAAGLGKPGSAGAYFLRNIKPLYKGEKA